MDEIDRRILRILQADSSRPVSEVAAEVGLSTTPCWRRIQNLEKAGVISCRVALLDRRKVNVGVTVFIRVRTSQHTYEWLQRFAKAVEKIEEIVEVYRLSGDIDYLLRVVVPDIEAYDAVYKRLIREVDLADVSSNFAMEEIKHTTALPLGYAR
jgi:Lrp/AsnC family transcriptional regulator